MARYKVGFDVWECTCGSVGMMGQPCTACGKTYADILMDKMRQARQEQPRKTRQRKYREPARRGEFIESFMFKKEKN